MQKNRKRKTSAGVTAILLIAAILCMSLVTPLNLTAVIAGIVFSMPAGKLFKEGKTTKVLSYAASLAAVVLAVMCLSSGSYNPFIYFRF